MRADQLKIAVMESLGYCSSPSNLPMSVLNISGFSGKQYKRFANTLLSKPIVSSYLEIGVLGGSTSIAGLYGNTGRLRYWNIDNFSEFGITKDKFLSNWNSHIKDDPHLIDNDCFKVNLNDHGISNVDIYFYDGAHDEESHYKALTYYYPAMSDSFIYMVDDWGWPIVKAGTSRAISDLKLKVHTLVEKTGADDAEGWWNGCGIFVLEK